MTVVGEAKVTKYAGKHNAAAAWLNGWLLVTRAAQWSTIQDVKAAYPAVDGGVRVHSGGTVTVFDVCGNNHRMIVTISYKLKIVNVLELMPHPEYGKNLWKKRY